MLIRKSPAPAELLVPGISVFGHSGAVKDLPFGGGIQREDQVAAFPVQSFMQVPEGVRVICGKEVDEFAISGPFGFATSILFAYAGDKKRKMD